MGLSEERELEKLNQQYEYDIALDTPTATEIGFTSNKYAGYIHVEYGVHWLCVESKSGDVNDIGELIDNIHKSGCEVAIDNPTEDVIQMCKEKEMMFVESGNQVSRVFSKPILDKKWVPKK